MENSEQTKPKPKIRKIKIFELTQKNFASIGIDASLMAQPYPFNDKILFDFLILISSIVCHLMFTFCEAKTFSEYVRSIYMFSLATLTILILVIVILNVTKIFNLIEGAENLANTSKWKIKLHNSVSLFYFIDLYFKLILALKYTELKAIFNKINPLIEKLSEIIFFVMTKFTPVTVSMPSSIYIYFIYFTTDLGTTVFELPTPLW